MDYLVNFNEKLAVRLKFLAFSFMCLVLPRTILTVSRPSQWCGILSTWIILSCKRSLFFSPVSPCQIFKLIPNSSSNAYLKPTSFPPLFSGLKPFVPSATSNSLAVSNLTTIAGELAAGDSSGIRTAWWTLTFRADARSVLDLYQQGKQIFGDLLTIPGTLWSINIQPINKQMINATVAGDSPSGLVDPSENLFRKSDRLNLFYYSLIIPCHDSSPSRACTMD